MFWQIIAFIGVVVDAFAVLMQRVVMKGNKSDPISYTIIFQILLGLITLVPTLILGRWVFPPLKEFFWQFILGMILWSSFSVSSFKALQTIGAGELTILYSTSTIVSIILGKFFLHENISLGIFLGTFLILSGIYLITTEKLSFKSRIGLFFGILTGILGGFGVVNDTVILKHYDPFSYMVVMSILPGLFLMLLFPKKLKQMKFIFNSKFMIKMFAMSLLYAGQAIAFYIALNMGAPISQLSPLFRTTVILTVILAAIFLGERKQLLRKFIASILTLLGVILIS